MAEVNNLKSIKLVNYKCFKKHHIKFSNTSILVGQNNAGKSTIIEALRILCISIDKLTKTTAYKSAPNWTGKGIAIKGITPSLQGIDVDLDIVFHNYGEPPAVVYGYFMNSLKIEIYIKSEKEIFVCAFNKGKCLKNRNEVQNANIPMAYVLPQIVPLIKDEKFITEQTMRGNQFSRRISRNFRSHLYRNKNEKSYNNLLEVLEMTWPTIKIEDIRQTQDKVYLDLRDRDFVAEIYNMGHGVQMWLQTMWFLAWCGDDSVIVLDEPDVYMHPDLQRKLIRLLNNRKSQIIIATHSVEIVAEVEPSNIVIINRNNDTSDAADNLPAVQAMLNSIGSVHNLSISRLIECKKYLYVEGKDVQILKRLYKRLYPESKLPIDTIPATATGGWGSWNIQKTAALNLKSSLKGCKVFFLYDRDYHTQKEIDKRKDEAKSADILLKIWNKKEIENYLICENVIAKIVANKNSKLDFNEVEKAIKLMIESFCEEMKENTLDKAIDEYKRKNKSFDYTKCKNDVKEIFIPKWEKDKTSMVSGKKLIAKLSEKCNEVYGVSFSAGNIASNMRISDIDKEIVGFLDLIENS